ncbi:MAG: PP2C family protein-serine/threonine phosphatase, partial [Chloroflexota bacterium]
VSAGVNSEDASRQAVDIIRERLESVLLSEHVDAASVLDAMVDAAAQASGAITTWAGDSDATTVVAGCCIGRDVLGCWCGDSRAYRIRAGTVQRVTLDHSWAEGVVRQGVMSTEEAAADPRAHMITRWLGEQDGVGPEIDTFHFSLDEGETLLCCSDGLYAYFSPPYGDPGEIGRILNEGSDLSVQLVDLQSLALERGGHDDITIAALRVRQ